VKILKAVPLSADAFAPFGDVLEAPAAHGRIVVDRALNNLRLDARLSLALVHKAPLALPLQSEVMERHRWSSQTFLPLKAQRWLVIIAPQDETGGAPDMKNALAFIAGGHQGVTFAANVWHHPFTVIDAPACFAVATWRNGRSDDDQFVDVAPFIVQLTNA